MLTVDEGQLQRIRGDAFRRRLTAALERAVPGFAGLEPAAQAACLDEALREAREWGLRSEQGLASYALALCYLDPGFPATSRYLRALLESGVPEVRKVYAMNEWVSARLGEPDALERADTILRDAFYRTHAWGAQR